jgi:hypothetical protein
MGANAPLYAVAVGSVLFLICVGVAVLLSLRALRGERKVKVKIKVLSMTFKIRVD